MCTNPITIKQDTIYGTHAIKVPCGKCSECLKTKQNDYFVRIYEELKQCSKATFVTLTYNDKTVPFFLIDGTKYLTVWKDDVTAWMKRLRTNYERKTGKKGVRFFLCSEYGPKTNRPHYHAIFFDMSYNDLLPALTDWHDTFGFYYAKDIDMSTSKSLECSSRYVSKYCCKGVFENPFRFAGLCSEDFSEVFSEIWHFVCLTDEALSLIRLRNDFTEVSIFKWVSPEIPRFLSGRGIATESCYY